MQTQSQPSSSNGSGNASGFSGSGSESGSGSMSYSTEQAEEVKRIRTCKDYYEILQVPEDATDEMITRAYRNLAIRVHPDKNKAPRANEAFRAVSNAYSKLIDHDARAEYDRGPRNSVDRNDVDSDSTRRRHSRARESEEEEDMADLKRAEELFRTFYRNFSFEGGFPSYREFRENVDNNLFRNPTDFNFTEFRANTGESTKWSSLICLSVPLILILTVGIAAINPFGWSPYSLDRTGEFSESRHTSQQRVQFFVRSASRGSLWPRFDQQYPLGSEARRSLELEIELEYSKKVVARELEQAEESCQAEEATRNARIERARRRNDKGALYDAEHMPLPKCKERDLVRDRLNAMLATPA